METLIRVLIADSGEDFRTLMREAVDQEPDMQVVATAADGVDALALITECRCRQDLCANLFAGSG